MARKTTIRSEHRSSKKAFKLVPLRNRFQSKKMPSDAAYPQESRSLMAQIEKESFLEHIAS
jgi:hypothetical protein